MKLWADFQKQNKVDKLWARLREDKRKLKQIKAQMKDYNWYCKIQRVIKDYSEQLYDHKSGNFE